jgi:flap endonuclease-1
MPDEEGIVQFMCKENNFNEERIRSSIKKLIKAKGTATQGRLDSFFTVTTTNNAAKRKVCAAHGLASVQCEAHN